MSKHKKPEPQKPWDITKADIKATTMLEIVWGTTRCLPPEEEISKEFWKGNAYTRVADAMFVGGPLPAGEVTFNLGFSQDGMLDFLMAHMRSFEPQHEHKIAGVAMMISKIVHITEILT